MSIFACVLALCSCLATPDSTVAARARAWHTDAAARSDGRKWGIDPKWIHLGAFSLPTAILGALPLDATSNPVLGAREAQLDAMRADIAWHAGQAIDEPAEPQSTNLVIPQP